jgi:hypothetical protein
MYRQRSSNVDTPMFCLTSDPRRSDRAVEVEVLWVRGFFRIPENGMIR